MKKKFFSISEARTVFRFLLVFLFHIGPAALLGSSGHFHPNSFLPSADVCCFLHGNLSGSGLGSWC